MCIHIPFRHMDCYHSDVLAYTNASKSFVIKIRVTLLFHSFTLEWRWIVI